MNKTTIPTGSIVVVDTSTLLLTGLSLLETLPKCELVIPTVVVKELSNKRTDERVGFLARQWLNLLEDHRVEGSLKKGFTTEKAPNVKIRVECNHRNQKSLPEHLQDGTHDSTILAVAVNLKADQKTLPDSDRRRVVVLSNDLPMRLSASVDLGLDAFLFNEVENAEIEPFSGRRNVVLTEEELVDLTETLLNKGELTTGLVDRLAEGGNARFEVLDLEIDTMPGKVQQSVFFDRFEETVEKVGWKTKVYGITSKNREQNIAVRYLRKPVEDVPIVSLGGRAGTGKTLMAIAVGLDEIFKHHRYDKMIVFRSVHELGVGQEMGFLPGDVSEKMGPWSGAINDAIETILKINGKSGNSESAQKTRKTLTETVDVQPITYLRGRSISNTYIVIEEAQNFSKTELLNILSRVGFGSKVVLTFDAYQVDNRFLKSGKRADIWAVVDMLKPYEFAHITLNQTERSLVAERASELLEKEIY